MEEKRWLISRQKLLERLSYDPKTGSLWWKVAAGGKAAASTRAGSKDGKGYRQINIGGKVFREHRLIWFYVTGTWPRREIDHRNGLGDDNRWDNLREATSTINKENRRRANRNNRLGRLGVGERNGRYRARIMVDRREIHLGRFDSPEQAQLAYIEAKRQYHQGGTL